MQVLKTVLTTLPEKIFQEAYKIAPNVKNIDFFPKNSIRKVSSGLVICSFDENVEKILIKGRKLSARWPNLKKKLENFQIKHFSSNCYFGHLECSFPIPAGKISTKI